MKLFKQLVSLALALIMFLVLLALYRAQPPHQTPIDIGDAKNPLHRQLGNPYALLTVIEYGDYECPFALAFERDVFPSIRSWLLNIGLIRYEFRDLPLYTLHPGAPLAAKVMRCAVAPSDRIWDLHARIFQGMDAGEWYFGDEYDEETLLQYAAAAGIDVNDLRNCLKSSATTVSLETQTNANFSRGY